MQDERERKLIPNPDRLLDNRKEKGNYYNGNGKQNGNDYNGNGKNNGNYYNMGVILGIYWDNGQGNGNLKSTRVWRVVTGVCGGGGCYRGYIGLYRGNTAMMENKMETAI